MFRKHIIEFQGDKRCSVVVCDWRERLQTYSTLMHTVVILDDSIGDCGEVHELAHDVIFVTAGEQLKGIEAAVELWRQLLEIGAHRHSLLVGIGGGTVTDLVNFVASTYMRGIRCVLMPTTLLAQVDAAIGGKCGINFGGLKNMVGTFNLPMEVVCDPEWLYQLPDREWRSGLAEVIKAAVIGDAELFDMLENTTFEELREDVEMCGEIVDRAVEVKCRIVNADLLEEGERILLNLGHTLGHAIESLTDKYNHGEAVAIGIAHAARRAAERGLCSEQTAGRIVALLERYGLPATHNLDEEALKEAVLHDKKGVGGNVLWVVPTEIGTCGTESSVWL